jgi:hypothetical protein
LLGAGVAGAEGEARPPEPWWEVGACAFAERWGCAGDGCFFGPGVEADEVGLKEVERVEVGEVAPGVEAWLWELR